MKFNDIPDKAGDSKLMVFVKDRWGKPVDIKNLHPAENKGMFDLVKNRLRMIKRGAAGFGGRNV